jgi:hypothetical protein
VVRRIALDFNLNHSAAVRYGNTGEPFEQKLFADLRDELAERFGGITAYTRAPVRGVWQEIEQVVRDDLISYEIMIKTLDEKWWREFRESLENRFQQQSIVVRAHEIDLL